MNTLICVQRAIGNTTTQDQPRTATVQRDYKQIPTKCRVYDLTDSSLARIERLAVTKQTTRAHMPACEWIYNYYTF